MHDGKKESRFKGDRLCPFFQEADTISRVLSEMYEMLRSNYNRIKVSKPSYLACLLKSFASYAKGGMVRHLTPILFSMHKGGGGEKKKPKESGQSDPF